ncbi:hypothetical protein BGZ54_002820 [Gamsiella multidivaricata]|nr:hypothetical protein BGZ54_002820 [Gamsiella multidivaricata]
MVKHLDERLIPLPERVKGVQKITSRLDYNEDATVNTVEALNDVSSSCVQILRNMGHNMRSARTAETTASSPSVFRALSRDEGAPFIVSGLSDASSVYSACTRNIPSPSIDSQMLPADSDEEHEIKATIIENIIGKVADQDQQDH